MADNQSTGNLGSNLKDGADKMSKDLNQFKDEAVLAKNKVLEKVQSKTEEFSKDIAQQWNGQMEVFQERFEELTGNVKVRLKTMDKSLHKSPYRESAYCSRQINPYP